MDGFDVRERTVDDMANYVMNENEFISLKLLFENSALFEPDSTFAVNLFDAEGRQLSEGISFGIMTSQMRELWTNCSTRAFCIEEVNLLISNFELHLFFVMVFDADDMPRCACVLISQNDGKITLFEKLRSVSTAPVDTIVTDCSPDWPSLLDIYFGNEDYSPDFQIAEWHLLSDWATRVDEMVSNRVDRFAIICALRRWTRATDPSLFESIVIEMFEAFREMELNSLAQLVDSQLTDPDFAKRWTPLNRNPLTDHSNPVLEISCRMFRERFLNCELCARLDEYAGLLVERIAEFNALTFSEVYTTSPMEPPRQVSQMYEDIDPSQLLADGTIISSSQVEMMQSSTESAKHDHLVFNNKRLKVENEEEMGAYVVVGEEEILDEVVEGAEAEELVEEAVLNEALGDLDQSSGHMVFVSQNVSGERDHNNALSPDAKRRARLKHMMQILHEKVESMADDETMELMETSLSHVVEQLKSSTPNTQMHINADDASSIWSPTETDVSAFLIDHMSVDTVPRDLRNLRACLLCSLVKSLEQFEMDGCENCDRVLHMKGDTDKVYECTSTNFDGMIAAMMPEESWVCKWQKINRKCKGVYAISVSGSLPPSVVSELKTVGIRYKPGMRDTASK
ncbi:transcription initiation protein Spt4 [Dictyocaulus viviparus]|uniref:Transcription elongation factor SPT4 n=1 Tax=Dictyocaulus viviparus TaxID=29172 RepID=A0A0D8Y6R3_DICVI|nr:transcription initiation protein Spt4 [Dictyocaulus viviparus]